MVAPEFPAYYDDLTVTYQPCDPDDEITRHIICWYRNRLLQPRFNSTIVDNEYTNVGETWFVIVQLEAEDHLGPTVQSQQVAIHDGDNRLPYICDAEITPANPVTGEPLSIEGYTFCDPDGDDEEGTEIRWYRNNQLLPAFNEAERIPANVTQTDDQWAEWFH